MPRPALINATESAALPALRRSVWQLAVLGIAAAAMLVRLAPQDGVAAAWSAVLPLSALAALYRRELLDAIRAHRTALAPNNARRRRASRSQPQARRTMSERASTKPHPAQGRHATG